MKTANVFVLTDDDGKLLAPAVQATVLAKYSRSPLSAKELVKGISAQDAEAFQGKWGVEYGHSSVAELATLPYCFEGVSIVASKVLERYQRAGYSEKSTRYQVFSEESFIEPEGAPAALREAATVAYRTYRDLERPVLEHVARLIGGASIEELVKKPAVKARAFDNLRYLLPAGTGTNLAGVFNARDARYVMSDLLGSDNHELRSIGQQMVEAAAKFAPVFAMGAKANTFELPIKGLGAPSSTAVESSVSVIDPIDQEVADRFEQRFWQRVGDWHGLTREAFAAHMETRGKHPVPEIFKTVPITFDVTMDFGAFRDLQRHRRCEQYVAPLGPDLGYLVPDDLQGTEFETPYRTAMDDVGARCKQMLSGGVSSSVVHYAVPLGYLHRTIFQMDLRELYYVSELRTQPQGHISYRRVAWGMAELARRTYASLMPWCRAIRPDQIGEHR